MRRPPAAAGRRSQSDEVKQPLPVTALIAEPEHAGDEVIAAVDLGSNSFHMVVARDRHGQLEIIDRLREMVRLASGLTDAGYLDSASQGRALGCLRRFGQRLRDMRAHQVRVVGTNTLRRAHNAAAFLDAAEAALGHPVEVISGIEEARLIYEGVSHHVESSPGQDLVVDIGGGSTELIVGHGYDPVRLESLWLGCVSISRAHFGNGRLTARRFSQARLAASLELRPIVASFRRTGWSRAIGSSGTVRAALRVTRELGLGEAIRAEALEVMIERMIAARTIEKLELPGLSVDRAPVFPGGIAILVEVLRHFAIDELRVSDGALREGLLYDMLGRRHHHDARERSIRAMQAKFHVDEEQAQRVDATAGALLVEVADEWNLGDEARHVQLLQWAARLHEAGLDIAHSKYHLHGAYLLANADMPGFTQLEQNLLAFIVGNHRRKIDELTLRTVPDDWRDPAFKLVVLLRLAVLVHRARSPDPIPPLRLIAGTNRLELRIDKGWLAANPLTHADLQQEQVYLGSCGFELVVTTDRISSTTRPAS